MTSKLKKIKNFIKGTLKVFWGMTKEDWSQMEHKLLRIIFGIIGFVIAALFWFYFFRHINPFGF